MDKINCNFKFENTLGKYHWRPVTRVNFGGKDFIVKKDHHNSPEYKLYTNVRKKLEKDKMDHIINLPEKIIRCGKYNYYVFEPLDIDYTGEYIEKMTNYKEFIDYTIQVCLQIFYANHILKLFHNDIALFTVKNIMIKKNSPTTIKVSKFSYEVKGNLAKVIDFGLAKSSPAAKVPKFYFIEKQKFPYISEIFTIYYNSCLFFFRQKFDTKINVYNKFLKKLEESGYKKKLKYFDIIILKHLFKLQEELK